MKAIPREVSFEVVAVSLKPSQHYAFRAALANRHGMGNWVESECVSTGGLAPPAPKNLTVVGQAHGKVMLVWSWKTDARLASAQFEVEQANVAPDALLDANTIEWLPSTADTVKSVASSAEANDILVTATVDLLSPGAAYTFRVVASNANGRGPPSQNSTVVAIQTPQPLPPINVASCMVAADAMDVSWQPPPIVRDCTVIEYKVEQQECAVESAVLDWSSWSAATRAATDRSATTIRVAGLKQHYAYRFRVAALTTWGLSPPSIESTPNGADFCRPSPLSRLEARIIGECLELSFSGRPREAHTVVIQQRLVPSPASHEPEVQREPEGEEEWHHTTATVENESHETLELRGIATGEWLRFRMLVVTALGISSKPSPPSEAVRLPPKPTSALPGLAAAAKDRSAAVLTEPVRPKTASSAVAAHKKPKPKSKDKVAGGSDRSSDRGKKPKQKSKDKVDGAITMAVHAEPADDTTVALVWTNWPGSESFSSHKYQTEVQRLDASGASAWLAATMHMQPLQHDGCFCANIFDLLPAATYRFRLAVLNSDGVEVHSETSPIVEMPRHMMPAVLAESEWAMQPRAISSTSSTAPSSAPSIGRPATVVVGLPSAPVSLRTSEVSMHSVRLDWQRPLADGGSMIQGYLVEQLLVLDVREPVPPMHAAWEAAIIDNRHGSALSVPVVGLLADTAYAFRVMAVNNTGCGDPAVVQVVTLIEE